MRRMKFVYAFLLSGGLLVGGAAIRPNVASAADGGSPAAAPVAEIKVPLQTYTLKNGLRVILSTRARRRIRSASRTTLDRGMKRLDTRGSRICSNT
jgi:hypothetical protein